MSEEKPGMTQLSGLEHSKENTSRGCWYMLHISGESAITSTLMEAYAHNFRNLCVQMTGCSCQNHCTQMLEDYPPEKYFGMKDEYGIENGCLYHSILCHNLVNERLDKKTYTYEEASVLYRVKTLKQCGDKGSTNENEHIDAVHVKEGTRRGLIIHELAKKYPELIYEMKKGVNDEVFVLFPIGD
jgi:hypothetical protein